MVYRSATDLIIEFVRDRTPVLRAEANEIARGAVQTGTWLVGLSSGFLALVAANPAVTESMSDGTRELLVTFLLVSVTAGVLQRVLFQAGQFPEWLLLIGLHSTLHGLRSEIVEPAELDEDWDREEIIRRLKAAFDLDYGFLREYDVPIEACRTAYSVQYEGWKEHEIARTEDLGVLVMAHEGKTAEESRRLFFPSSDPEGDLEKTRRKARRLNALRAISTLSFYVAGGSFVAALIIVGLAI